MLHINFFEIKNKIKIENVKLNSTQMFSFEYGDLATLGVHDVGTYDEIIMLGEKYSEKWLKDY